MEFRRVVFRSDSEAAIEALHQDVAHVIIDRIKVTNDDDARLFEAIESAMSRGQNAVNILLWDRHDDAGVPAQRRFESTYICSSCRAPHHEPVPALLSPESGWGDCEDCNGYGRRDRKSTRLNFSHVAISYA